MRMMYYSVNDTGILEKKIQVYSDFFGVCLSHLLNNTPSVMIVNFFAFLYLTKWILLSLSYLFYRKDECHGKRFCCLWRDLHYWQLQQQVHYHQLCIRHQNWKAVESQHTVHQSVHLQLNGGLQPQRESAVRLGSQASGHLSHHFWETLDL